MTPFLSRSARAASVLLCLLCAPLPAVAQYRNQAFYFEGGAQGFELAPLTATTVVGTYAARHAQQRATVQGLLPAGLPRVASCWDAVRAGHAGPPCRQDYFGMTDGPYIGMGYQRLLGDLLLDVSENPLVEGLVFSWRGGGSGALSLPWTHDVPRPLVFVHNEVGLRWNVWDEKVRPFVGLHVGIHTRVDPLGSILAVKNMGATCRRAERGEDLQWDEVCVRDSSLPTPTGTTGVDANWAWFSSVQAPVFFSLRPEAGVEYFFMEDISLQLHGSVAVFASPVPAVWWNRPPFMGLSPRGTASVAFYF